MNKIFKVVWSKSKQCYVVVSEIAKNTTGKKKIIVASILATLAMQTVSITNVQAINENGTGSQASVAIGYDSKAWGTTVGGVVNPSVAVGTGSYAEGNSALALGTRAWAKGSYNVSVGREAKSSQDYGIAIGYQADVSAIHGMALGERAAASGQIAVAVGANAKATGANSYAGGFNSASSGTSSVALGESATSSGDTSVAIGKNTVASGGDAVSIGASSQATGADSLALGKNAQASNGDTIAIGQDSVAQSLNAVALGKTSKATGASATALGPQSTASATYTTAIGMNSVANQEYAIAIGGSSEATVQRGVALGTYSKADTASGVSGYDGNANRTNKYAGLAGNALTSTWGAVSIGDGTNTRQITGLAAGTKDTDAVNVAQLKSVNLAVTGDNSSSGDVNLANSKLAITGDTTYITTTAAGQGIAVKGVKKDITVSNGTATASVGMADAKNVAEAINQANADQKITYKANGSTANSVKLSDGLNFTNGTSTVATVGTNGQVTYDLNAATKKSITDSETAVKRTISLGADSGTRSSQSLNNSNVDFNVKGASGSYITTSMTGNTVTINTTKGTIQSDASGTASLSGADGLATAQNVATAINKAKEGSAWNLAVNTGAAQKVAGGAKVTLQNGNNIALTQTGTTITVGTTSQLTADAVTVGSGTNQIVLNGTTGEVSGKSIKTGNSTLNTNGLTISGGPSVTSTGINAGNKVISGVSQGVAGNDAVNKSQMDAAIKTVADSTNELGKNTVTLAAQSGSTTGQALNSATGIKFYINGESGSDALISTSASGTNVSVASTQKLKDAVTQAANAANKDLSNLSTAGDTHIKDLAKTAATWNVSTNGSNNTAVAGGETVNFVNGDNVAITNTGRNITIGTAKNVSFDKVTLGGITIDKTDGINAGGKEIKGIADGTGADSAVSKGQMETAIANAQTAASSTEKVVAKTLTGDNNLATVTGQTGTAKNETYEVAVSENAVKAVAVNAAQDAVKVAGTGLATVSDATAGGVKTYTVNVEEGKLVLDDATGNVGAAGSTQGTTAGKDGVATTQNVAKAINEAVTKANANNAQALADAEHKFDGDTGTTSVRKHGEVLSVKGGVTTPADLTTGNIGVVSDGAGTLNVRLAKALTGLTSATYTDGAGNTQTVTGASSTITDGAGNTTALTKGGLSTTDGTNTTTVTPNGMTATDGTNTVKVEGSGIDAGNTEIKNVAAGTTNTSAVNKKQMDDAITKATGDATHEFGGDDTTVVSRKHGEQLNIKGGASTTAADLTDGNIAVLGDATTGTLNLKLAKALTGLTSATYTDAAGNTTTVTGGTTTIADAAGNTQTLAPTKSEIKDNAGVSTVTTKDGVTAKDAAGNTTALTKGGLSTTDGTNTTTVTPNGMTATDGTNTVKVEGSGIDAGNTEIKNVAAGTTNTSAVNKKQMEDAVKAGGTWKITTNTGATTEVTGGDTVDFINGDNIAITNTGRNITIGTAKTVSFDKVTVGGITIDKTDGINAGGKELKGIADATAADSAVSKGQMDTAIANAQTAATSTEKVVAKTLTGDNNLATVTGQTGTAKNETYEVAVSENAVKAVAVNAAQDAVKVAGTGLATVSDATAGGVKTYTVNVEEGKLVLDDATGNVGAAGSTQGTTAGKDGVATTQNVAKAINEAVTKANANNAQALADAEHKFDGDTGTTSVRKHGEVLSVKGGVTTLADLTTGNIGVVSDGAGTLNVKLAKALTGLTSATYTDAAGNTTTVTGGSTTIADAAGNTQTLAPTKSEIKDNAGVSTVTTKDGVTAKDAAGNTTALTNGGVSTTDGAGNTTALTKGGLSTTDGTNTTTVTPNGMTATDGTNTVKVEGSGIDAGNTEIKNVAAGTTNTSAVNKKQMDDAITKATGDATHEFGGDDTTVVSRKHGEQLNIKGGASTTAANLTDGNIAVLGDATTGTLNLKLAKALTGLTSATYTDAAGNTTTVTGGSTTIADAAGNTQTLAPTKSEIKDNAGVSTMTTKDGVTAKDAAGNTTALTNGGVNTTDGAGNTTALTKGGLSTTDGTNTTTVTPNGMTATDGTNTVKVEGSGIDAGNTEIKNVAAGTTNTSAVNKKQMDDAITKATGDATHEFGGDDTTVVSRKHGEQLNIKGGASTTAADLTDGNIAVLGDATTGTLNLKLAKALTGLTSATYTDAAGNTTTVTGGTTTIADAAGNTQTLAPMKSEIKDNTGVSTVTTKDGVTAKDAAGNTTALTNGGVSTTDGAGNTTALTKGGLSTTDGTNTTTVTPNGMTATDGTNTVKVEGSGIDAGNTEIKNVAAGTTNTSAVNKKQMDDAITKATGDATHEFGGDDTTVVSRKHGEQLNIKGGASTTAADLTDGNIAVLGDATTGTLNLKLAKALTGLTSATYTDAAGNTTTVTGGSTTIADAAGNTQTLAPTKSEIKDNAGVSTVTTKDGVTAKDAAGNTTALTKGGLSTTDGTNTTTVTPNGMTATDGTNTVKVEGSGIDAGNTEIKNVAAGTTNTSAVNKKQMDDAITKATGDATHEFGGDDTTVVSRKHGEQLNIKGGASTAAADLTDGNIAVLGDATTGTLNLKLAKALTGLTSATYTDAAGNTTTVTGGSTTIADAAGNTQTLAPTKSEIKDNNGVSTVTTKDGVTATDAAGNTTALTNGGVSTTDGAGNTTALTKGGLSTTDGTNTTTVTPNGMTATDGTNTVKVEGSGIDAGNTEIKNVAAGTTNTSAVNKKQMDDAITKATGDATHEFGGDDTTVVSRKHGEQLNIKGGASTTAADLTDGNIAVLGDATTGTLNLKLAKALTGLTSATYTDAAGNTTTVTGGTTTIADAAGNTQTLAPTKSEIKDNTGVSTVTTKDGVTAKDATGNTTALTNSGVSTTDAAGNTTALTNGGVSTTDGAGNTTALTKGGLSTIDGTNTTTVTPNGLTATDGTNTVKVNGSGIDAGNTEIKNVADGTTPHSAINKNQLDTAVNRLQNATDNISLNIAGNNGTGNIKLKDQVLHIDGTNGLTTKANGQSVTVGLDDATMSTINNTAALANNAAKKDLSNIDQAGKEVIKDTAAWHVKVNSMAPETVKGGDTVTFNDGHNITITNTGKDITVATKKEVTFDKVSVGGITIDKQADHISGVSSITGSGSGAPTMTFNAANGSTPSSVSMDSNLDMGGKQINNVAAATRPTDAVNKQQVDQAMKSLAGMADSAAKKYASKAGANAAALAALKPIQYDPLAPTQIMAGIGNYKSQTAVALGVAHYANEDTMFNIGASLDSQDAMLNAGVTHKFGSSAERKNIPDRYKGGPISSIYVMQDEVSALKAQNSEMQAMLDKQSSENAAIIAENKILREQNEEMQRKVDLILSKLQ